MSGIILAEGFDVFSQGIVNTAADGSLSIVSAPQRFYAWGAVFAAITIGLVIWWIRRRGWKPLAALAFAFVVALIMLPNLAIERITVNAKSIDYVTGSWFAPTTRQISLEGLNEVAETVRERRTGRRTTYDVYWDFRYRGGKVDSVDLPDLFEANRAPVATFLMDHDINVREE